MLRLEDVSVDIAGVPVLRGVSLRVPPGGRVALIGRNGAGKTTTLRTLMGLISPRRGSIMLDGQECVAVPAHRRARLGIGYAPEERGLSGGQGKMVALGRALMVGTRAVLLDEPFQGLAPALALRYAEALGRLRSHLPNVAILITESSPDLLQSLVDGTFVIERGEIAAA
jgi:branched-chain amino acid transport system ATP-binding protein